jgi:hypothetical protein
MTSWKGKGKETEEKGEESGEGQLEETEAVNDQPETSFATALQNSRRRLPESDEQWTQFIQAAGRIGEDPGAGFGVLKTTAGRIMKAIGDYLIPESGLGGNPGLENIPTKERSRESPPVDPPANKRRAMTSRSIISPRLNAKSPSTPSMTRERYEEIYPPDKIHLTPPRRPNVPVNFDVPAVTPISEKRVAYPPAGISMIQVKSG